MKADVSLLQLAKGNRTCQTVAQSLHLASPLIFIVEMLLYSLFDRFVPEERKELNPDCTNPLEV